MKIVKLWRMVSCTPILEDISSWCDAATFLCLTLSQSKSLRPRGWWHSRAFKLSSVNIFKTTRLFLWRLFGHVGYLMLDRCAIRKLELAFVVSVSSKFLHFCPKTFWLSSISVSCPTANHRRLFAALTWTNAPRVYHFPHTSYFQKQAKTKQRLSVNYISSTREAELQ